MILDIGFIILLIIFILLGYKRGFSLEFFNMFKYILIIFITNYIYKFFFDSEKIKSRNQLKIFIIMVVIQYIVYSVILIMNGKFLKTIKIKRFDKFSGIIFGIFKIFFVSIIIYIVIITGSLNSKKIRNIRDESVSAQFMTKYALKYLDSFPNFIKNDVENYAVKKRENQIINDILSNYKKLETEEFKNSRTAD
ncbi:CvpA family protein [Leptotrichia buccalis]|uniref:Colicin V production protein n=1 Tax=Leptotrichia buccalis (strain ATCC 14201 / DSM 1135 / JCM 12969 / NCTC 10249 / C-1013-b) TaxID=523794 RepID=C7NC34_LEPBD|nr:CvpA family protein [Leptotrichia buccalis]ACV39715.1 Colicin V production protein [Leptotrichia buccalis C-1013-b]